MRDGSSEGNAVSFSRLLARLPGGQHLLDLLDGLQRDVHQIRADLVEQLPEGLLVPGRTAPGRDQAVRGGGDAVLEERGDGAVRITGQRELLLIAQLALGELGRIGRDVQQDEAGGCPPTSP